METNQNNNKKILGKNGEEKACTYLKKHKYKIIERNFLCRQGEIDIVAFDKKTNEYVFIEVKTRTNKKYGNPEEAVNEPKQKHIYNSTKYYIYKNKLENAFIRFDVIVIYKNNLVHLKNCEFNQKIYC